eukprot:251441_1
MVMGRNQTIGQLLELMSIEFRLAQHAPSSPEAMVGLLSAEQCTHRKKLGHSANDCWVKHPNKRSESNKARSGSESRKCFRCGKVGHLKRNCKDSDSTENVIVKLTGSRRKSSNKTSGVDGRVMSELAWSRGNQ